MGDILLHMIYLCTIGMSLYTSGWLLLKADRNDTTGALAACQILVMIWCVPQLFAGTVTTVGMKYLAYGISYVGICFIGPAWLEFSFRYCGRVCSRFMRAVLFGISAVNFSIFLCNDSCHLFYRQFTVEQVVYGPVFYFHMLYTYGCVFCGMFAVLKEFARKRVAVRSLALILFTAAVPLGFNLLYISGAVKSSFDLTPPAFSLSSLLMLLAVFRYDFLDINAAAFGQIFSSIGEGVVIYNRQGRITYCNKSAAQWLDVVQGQEFTVLKKRMEGLGLSVDIAGGDDKEKTEEVQLPDGTKLRIRQYIHRSKNGNMVAGTFLLTDVSEYYELLRQSQELEEFRRDLAVEQERNRIAQEVHDTTGHTLTMIQSLLRLLRSEIMQIERGQTGWAQTNTGAYLQQAQELVTGGIRELRCGINQMRQEQGSLRVTESIRRLADSVREFEIEIDVQGKETKRYDGLAPIVYSCFREAVTNCLKYAQASHMDVIIKFQEEHFSLYVFDDGQGCSGIQESNGIRGIRERVKQAGGTVRFMTAEGEGFQMYLELPVPEKKLEFNNGGLNNSGFYKSGKTKTDMEET